MRENLVFVKNICIFFLKCNYISNSLATFEQPWKDETRLDLRETSLKCMFKFYSFDSTKVIFSINTIYNNMNNRITYRQ